MNEQEWQECTDSYAMLRLLEGKVSDRKWRLFCCSCCRRLWHFLDDKRGQHAVEVAELFADKLVDSSRRNDAETEARNAWYAAAGGEKNMAARAGDLKVWIKNHAVPTGITTNTCSTHWE